MSDKREVKVVVFDGEQYESDWPPVNPREFLNWFADKIAAIPKEFAGSARVDIEAVSSYEDSQYAKIAIFYYRPETDFEHESRRKREQENLERRKRDLLFELERLSKDKP